MEEKIARGQGKEPPFSFDFADSPGYSLPKLDHEVLE